MKKIGIIAFVCIFLFISNNAYACTIFSYSQDNLVLVGNNEDYFYDVKPKIWIKPPTEKEYGRICFGWNLYWFFQIAQGGMNEHGLFIDAASTPKSYSPPKSNDKKSLPINYFEKVLAECANVDEAIVWLQKHNYGYPYSNFPHHLLLADKSGNSVIIEWVKGEFIVIKKKGLFQVATNFLQSHPELGGGGREREKPVEEFLSETKDINVNSFAKLLSLVAREETNVNGRIHSTLYSNVYD